MKTARPILLNVFHYTFNSLYTGRLFHCYMFDWPICHFRSVGSFFVVFIFFFIENPISK